jgi:hypothetical protein
MRPNPRLPAVVLLAAGLSACTFVPIQPAGVQVRVAAPNQPLACERLGEITVSVQDRIGPIARNELRIRDELEVLARNEAPALGADTVQALGEPMDGEQRFRAWRCGPSGAVPATAAPPPAREAETLPLRDP